MPRPLGRHNDELRPLSFKRRYTRQAPGSVLVRSGRTTVLCTCCVEQAVPPFLVGKGQGWLSAEYGMLPGSTSSRKPRDQGGKVDGRTVEIQRLIGRSLRAIVDLGKLGERTVVGQFAVLWCGRLACIGAGETPAPQTDPLPNERCGSIATYSKPTAARARRASTARSWPWWTRWRR